MRRQLGRSRARAQQPVLPIIGFLDSQSPVESEQLLLLLVTSRGAALKAVASTNGIRGFFPANRSAIVSVHRTYFVTRSFARCVVTFWKAAAFWPQHGLVC